MAGTSSRGNPRLGDIVRTVAVMGGLVLLLWGFGQLFTVTPDEPTRTVDYAAAARGAQDVVPYDLLAPRSLPAGWRATSARFERPTGWHLGVVTDDDEYVGLEQDRVPADELVERFAEGSSEVGPVTVAGRGWTERRGARGAVVLVRSEGGTTTLVTGDTDRATVLDYVASLSSP